MTTEYNFEKTLLDEAGASITGEDFEVPEKPALAAPDIEANAKFGVFFNSDVAGLSFLEDLDKGLSSRGGTVDAFTGSTINPGRRLSRGLQGSTDFDLS